LGRRWLELRFFFQAEDGIRDFHVTGVQTCALPIWKKDHDYRGEEITYPRVFGGLTFTRIDWGFSRLVDNGSFKMGEENQFLEIKKASNFGFDIAQIGIRFNDDFKVYASVGFEWNYLRLKSNVILDDE